MMHCYTLKTLLAHAGAISYVADETYSGCSCAKLCWDLHEVTMSPCTNKNDKVFVTSPVTKLIGKPNPRHVLFTIVLYKIINLCINYDLEDPII